MSQQKKLQMMTFIPKTSTIKVYTLGFPATWKDKLAALAIAGNPSFNYDSYMLPLCSLLGKLCANWVNGLIEISNLRKNSDDSKWIVCLSEINKHMCEEICVNLKAAALSFYADKINDEKVKSALNDFLKVIDSDELFQSIGQDEVEIIDKDGKIANPYAYNGLCLKIMSKLKGEIIKLDGEDLILNRSARNELMSQVLSAPNGDLYAYVFSFSLQTIPADNYPMLLLNCSRRRFKNSTKRSKTLLKNKMSVYVKHKDETCYYKLSIKCNWKKECMEWEWDEAERMCYDFTYPHKLPKANDVKEAIEEFNSVKNNPQILCGISAENSFESETEVGTGVSVQDEESMYNSIYELISDVVDKSSATAKAIIKRPKLNPDKDLRDIRSCLSKTGYKKAVIEIYSLSKDFDLADKIKNSLDKLLLQSNSEENDFCIRTEIKTLGDYADPLSKEDYKKEIARNARIRLISDRIGRISEDIMAGSIIVLPNNNSKEKDAKDLLRCGFAMAGRVTQFINPDDKIEANKRRNKKKIDYKIQKTICDLLRQFGYSKCPTQWSKLPKYPVIAIDASTNLWSMTGKKVRALPMMLKFNADDRMITVESPVFNNGLPLTYYKACLELCKFSMTRDCEKVCNEAIRRYIEQKLKGLENLYRDKDAIVIVSGDGFVRNELWPGISNKKIETYSFSKKYCPESIDIGNRAISVALNLSKSKLRVVRIRENDEIPDYYLTDGEKSSGNADGIYSYHEVYYASAAEKSRDDTYRWGDNESSISNPDHYYRGKKLIEYFPLYLCQDDDPIFIVNYLNELRGLSPQYNKITNFPLPLHYLSILKEYFNFS